MPETLKTLINRAAIVSKHVDIVNEKSFKIERFPESKTGKGDGGTTRLKIAVGDLIDRSNGKNF